MWVAPLLVFLAGVVNLGNPALHPILRKAWFVLIPIAVILMVVGVYFHFILKDEGEVDERSKEDGPVSETSDSENECPKLLKEAIKDKRMVEFLYKKPKESDYTKRTVRPFKLNNSYNKFSDSTTLCLFGFCELRKKTRNFALKRMKDIKIL